MTLLMTHGAGVRMVYWGNLEAGGRGMHAAPYIFIISQCCALKSGTRVALGVGGGRPSASLPLCLLYIYKEFVGDKGVAKPFCNKGRMFIPGEQLVSVINIYI